MSKPLLWLSSLPCAARPPLPQVSFDLSYLDTAAVITSASLVLHASYIEEAAQYGSAIPLVAYDASKTWRSVCGASCPVLLPDWTPCIAPVCPGAVVVGLCRFNARLPAPADPFVLVPTPCLPLLLTPASLQAPPLPPQAADCLTSSSQVVQPPYVSMPHRPHSAVPSAGRAWSDQRRPGLEPLRDHQPSPRVGDPICSTKEGAEAGIYDALDGLWRALWGRLRRHLLPIAELHRRRLLPALPAPHRKLRLSRRCWQAVTWPRICLYSSCSACPLRSGSIPGCLDTWVVMLQQPSF